MAELPAEQIIENQGEIPSPKNNRRILAFVLILIPLISLAFVLYFTQKDKLFPPKPPLQKEQPIVQSKKPNEVIALVGKEKIYQSDLETEQRYSPLKVSSASAKILLEKIVEDSILLQGANADKLITLNKKVFNSPSKDYLKRAELVLKAKKLLAEKEDGIAGAVVSIWFYNMKPGEIGYQKGKEIALEKIQKLQTDVQNKKITIEQAGELIKKDTSLAKVDKQYKSNAIFKFNVKKNEKIYFDPEFDKIIWKLKQNQVSKVVLSKDVDRKTDKMIPAVYSFAQVKKIIKNGKVGTFEAWLAKKKKIYEIKYY